MQSPLEEEAKRAGHCTTNNNRSLLVDERSFNPDGEDPCAMCSFRSNKCYRRDIDRVESEIAPEQPL
ncbi:G-patch domain protein, putative [Anopheles sinensis]|uniref:G-patch domain protein, putative n=1 Tax=Anopheles sinensis TaxID=74873 RepID=A0A084VQ10_ANOSI|nr:G-patch domain protein, putative [Anopheles sinensis]